MATPYEFESRPRYHILRAPIKVPVGALARILPPTAAASVSEPDFSSPDDVERAFYQAFAATDLALMTTLWLNNDEVACVHPGGDLLTGRNAVIGSWRSILVGAEQPTVLYRVLHRQHLGDLALHLVEERIGPAGADPRRGLNRLLATNVYRRTANGWRMTLHHGSLPLTERADDAAAAGNTNRLH